MSFSRYTFLGKMSSEASEDSNEVHCFNASLSEQDLERVGGLSGRAVW